jgi:hypothetical protein
MFFIVVNYLGAGGEDFAVSRQVATATIGELQ